MTPWVCIIMTNIPNVYWSNIYRRVTVPFVLNVSFSRNVVNFRSNNKNEFDKCFHLMENILKSFYQNKILTLYQSFEKFHSIDRWRLLNIDVTKQYQSLWHFCYQSSQQVKSLKCHSLLLKTVFYSTLCFFLNVRK